MTSTHIQTFKVWGCAAALSTLLAACGGGGGGDPIANTTPEQPVGDCPVLCVQGLSADKVALLKGDTLNLSATLGGSLKDKANYSWSLGDGKAAQTSASVNNYSFDDQLTLPDNMFRITLTVNAKDDQGNVQTASKTIQINAMLPRAVVLSNTAVLALGQDGSVYSSGTVQTFNGAVDRGSRLARGNTGTPASYRNFANARKVLLNGLTEIDTRAKSLGECMNATDTCQSFFIDGLGGLWGAGNDFDDFSVAGGRSTAVGANANLGLFEKSFDAGNAQLTNIKYVATGVNGVNNSSSYALRADGAAYGAGNNADGRLGVNSSEKRINAFSRLRDANGEVTGIVQLAWSRSKVLALKSDGTLWGAGLNASGNGGLGVANSAMASTPFLVPLKDSDGKDLSNVKLIAADANGAAYAVGWDGRLHAHGTNTYGQLGINQLGGSGPSAGFALAQEPMRDGSVPLQNVDAVFTTRQTAGGNRTFVRDAFGWVYVAGENGRYFSGDSDAVGDPIVFKSVMGNGSGIKAMQASTMADNFSTFLDADGTVRVMGASNNIGLPYAVTSPLDIKANMALVRSTGYKVRYANWRIAGGGAFDLDRSDRTTFASNDYGLSFVDQNPQPMVWGGISDYVGAVIGRNGELYLSTAETGNGVNLWATESVLVSMNPVRPDGSQRFKLVTGR